MQVKSPIDSDVKKVLKEVESELNKLVVSENGKITDASRQTIRAGGKRLRPALVLICGGLENKKDLMPAAVAVEAVHTASLIHDDLIDKAQTRRGMKTINFGYGEKTAIIVGDYIFAKAFEKIAEVDDSKVVNILAKSAIDLTMGEILQQKTAYNPNQTEAFYLSKIKFKTASLFEASCKIAAIIRGMSSKEINALALYGANLGNAFQIYDDILDITGDSQNLGKPVGNDLYDGVMTLPYIYASDKSSVRKIIEKTMKKVDPPSSEIKNVLELVLKTDAVKRTRVRADNFITYAVNCLNIVKDKELVFKLKNIASFVVDRYH